MKSIIVILCAILLSAESHAGERSSSALLKRECQNSSPSTEKNRLEVVCLRDIVYHLRYDKKSRKIILSYDHKEKSLQQISKGRDPTLVGAENIIGFLPDKLQVYKKMDVLLYISSMRTNSGSGAGQCGAGSEIYLNFLSVKTPGPKVNSSILIGSCDYSIELDNQNIPNGQIGEISAEGGQLRLHFLNYKNLDGSPVATITPDRKNLMFN